jgi:excisionase family DNA binding protein
MSEDSPKYKKGKDMMTPINVFGVELLRVEDLSGALGCNMETIRRYIRTGKLKAQKIGRRYFVSKENFVAFTGGTITIQKKANQ